MSAVEDEVERECRLCEKVLPVSGFVRSRRDGYGSICRSYRSPVVVSDPNVEVDVLSFRAFDFRLPDDWKDRIRPGANVRVTLALHVEHAEQRPTREPRWISRWLEVKSVEG